MDMRPLHPEEVNAILHDTPAADAFRNQMAAELAEIVRANQCAEANQLPAVIAPDWRSQSLLENVGRGICVSLVVLGLLYLLF